MTAAIATQDLSKHFGGIVATNQLSLAIAPGARHALIGPNGAGKTTLINLLTGVLRPTAGRILLAGRDITTMAPHARVARGLVRTFQINQLFATFTPLEAVMAALAERRGTGWRWFAGGDRAHAPAAIEILERFHLTDVMSAPTTGLPYGKQRLLEIALAIAAEPSVLLLDEPAAGVPEAERHEILATVAALPRDVTVLLIEHDMDLVFTFAERISVLVNGALLAEGEPDAIARDHRVRAAYLGESHV